jgi:hypothetical protein
VAEEHRVIDEAELRRMSPGERRELARALAKLELPHPMQDPVQIRRRRLGLIVMTSICLILAAWIGILAVTLPKSYTAHHWRAAWIGLDIAELASFAGTAWAAWRERQVVIPLLIVTGTLLICDAWFDIVLSGRGDFRTSVLTAVFAELPLAFLLFAGARRLIRLTVYSVMRLEGITGPLPPLRKVPLFADGFEETIPHRFRGRAVTPEDRVSSR